MRDHRTGLAAHWIEGEFQGSRATRLCQPRSCFHENCAGAAMNRLLVWFGDSRQAQKPMSGPESRSADCPRSRPGERSCCRQFPNSVAGPGTSQSQRLPEDPVVDAIDVGDEDAIRPDLLPGNPWHRHLNAAGQLAGGVPDPTDDRFAGESQEPIIIPSIPTASHDLGCCGARVEQVSDGLVEAARIVRLAYSDSASALMSSSRSVRPPALMTSTPVPSSASSSRQRRTWSTSVRPDWKSTSRSTSLVGVAVPLATEPNTRTFDAPWAFATRTMSDLCERSMVKLGAFGSVAVARCAPMLTILGAGWGRLTECRVRTLLSCEGVAYMAPAERLAS